MIEQKKKNTRKRNDDRRDSNSKRDVRDSVEIERKKGEDIKYIDKLLQHKRLD